MQKLTIWDTQVPRISFEDRNTPLLVQTWLWGAASLVWLLIFHYLPIGALLNVMRLVGEFHMYRINISANEKKKTKQGNHQNINTCSVMSTTRRRTVLGKSWMTFQKCLSTINFDKMNLRKLFEADQIRITKHSWPTNLHWMFWLTEIPPSNVSDRWKMRKSRHFRTAKWQNKYHAPPKICFTSS